MNGELHAYNQITPERHPKITGEDGCSIDIFEEVIFHWTFYLSKLNGDGYSLENKGMIIRLDQKNES